MEESSFDEPQVAAPPQPDRPCIAVVQDDVQLFELLRDVFGGTHRLTRVPNSGSMTAIAREQASLLFVGPLPSDGPALTVWDVVALARAHRELRAIPIVVFTSDAQLLTDEHHLRRYDDVHLLGIPFELDVLQHVAASVERRTSSIATAVPR